MATKPKIDQPFGNVADVLAGLTSLESYFLETKDRRGVFVSAYLIITKEMKKRIDAGHFADGPWVSSYLVAFADLYRGALDAYEAGHANDVPAPWKVAFDVATQRPNLVLQDLMLGINAHINHDLPLALLRVSFDPKRPVRESDHTRVNAALRVATKPVQERLYALYAPQLRFFDLAAGALDELLTNFSFSKARRGAWRWAVKLVDATSVPARQQVQRDLENHAAMLATAVAQPSTAFPSLTGKLAQIEVSMSQHWTDLFRW